MGTSGINQEVQGKKETRRRREKYLGSLSRGLESEQNGEALTYWTTGDNDRNNETVKMIMMMMM